MNFEQLKAFLMVVNLRSFSKAAEALYIPQPTLSNRIRQLEKEMGVLLFVREKKRVRLTEAGEYFLSFAAQTVEKLNQVRSTLDSWEQGIKPTVHVGFPVVYNSSIIPEVMGLLIKKCKNVRFLFSQMVSSEIISAIKNTSLQLGITSYTIDDPAMTFIKINEQSISVILSPEHYLSKEASIHLEEACAYPLVVFKRDTLYQNSLLLTLKQRNITYNIAVEINDLYAIKEMIKRGLGISFLPNSFVKNELETSQLVSRPLQVNPFSPYKTYLTYRKEDWNTGFPLSDIVKILLNYFSSHYDHI